VQDIHEKLIYCQKCGAPYHWRKSTAELKFTFCGQICQTNVMGGTTKDLIDIIDHTLIARFLKELKPIAAVVA